MLDDTVKYISVKKIEQSISSLIGISAKLLRAENFISEFAEDNPKTTPKSILVSAKKQRDELRLWAIELKTIANQLNLM